MSKRFFSLPFAFALIAVCNGFQQRYNFGLDTDHLVNMVTNSSNRVKRSFCTEYCVFDFANDQEAQLPNLVQFYENQFPMKLSVSKSEFKTYCQLIMKITDCIKNCPSSTTNKSLLAGFSVAKLMCAKHFHEIYNDFECMKSANEMAEQQCTNGNCLSLKHGYTTFYAEYRTALQIINWSRYKVLLGDYCEYGNCSIGCAQQIYNTQCGSKIANLVEVVLTKAALNSIKKILIYADRSSYWPDSCEKFLHRQSKKIPESFDKTHQQRVQSNSIVT